MSLADYQAKVAAHNKVREALNEEGKKIFIEVIMEWFKNHPKAETISWTQYTPYFADGDPCVFGVNCYDDCIDINGVDWYSISDNPNRGELSQVPSSFSKEDYKELADLIGAFDEDTMEDFGEGRVVVHRDGTMDVEDYEHD